MEPIVILKLKETTPEDKTMYIVLNNIKCIIFKYSL